MTTDLMFEEAGSLVFRLDATPLLNKLFEAAAVATESPYIDSRYDAKYGKGIIKQFRPDGSRLELSLARYDEFGVHPHGIIIGGDFPPGDLDSAQGREGSGMALYDGKDWIHLWCSANEGIAVSGGGLVYEPHKWQYVSGKTVKKTLSEVIFESTHRVIMAGTEVLITRRLGLKAEDDFVTLSISVTNSGGRPLLYDYAYGDEPWVGKFGSSIGDVGWYPGGWVDEERYVDPEIHNIAGFADIGNRRAGDPGEYSGYANFIQWEGSRPTMAYFSNDFHSVRPGRPLSSRDNRILNIVWKNQKLEPGRTLEYRLHIGFFPKGIDLMAASRVPQ